MNIWILTIGSSDVQLKTKANWTTHFRKVRDQLDDRGFSPWDGKEGRFGVQSRVLGAVYSHPDAEQSFNDLVFPLVDNFIAKISKKSIKIDKIILILSDQSIFDRSDRRSPDHAYWKDTCTLQPLLEKYLKQELEDILPNLQFQDPPLILKAKSKAEGLDNWNSVLDLVKERFGSIQSDSGEVYVSHQAGTPAISSAVQFCSLAKFGDRVRFLVSNEDKPELTGLVESSNYLRGIKREQAKELLENYHYAGVDQLIGTDLKGENRTLLDAALQWNIAKFDSPKSESYENNPPDTGFLEILKNYPRFVSEVAERTRGENWWWIAYEEAYLSVIRQNQGNIVEAFFHSFRAFEYIFFEWCKQEIDQYIEWIKGVPYLSPLVLDDANNYFSNKRCNDVSDFKKIKFQLEQLKQKLPEEIKSDDRVKLDMSTVCKIFRAFRYKEYKHQCKYLNIFWDTSETGINVSNKRNFIVHQVQGMSTSDLWKFWDTSTLEEWTDRLLEFLNFITKKEFVSLEEASLMAKVHDELVNAIENL